MYFYMCVLPSPLSDLTFKIFSASRIFLLVLTGVQLCLFFTLVQEKQQQQRRDRK